MYKRKHIRIILAAAMALGMLIHTPSNVDADEGSPDDLLIIANKSLSTNRISVSDLRALFLKKKSTVGGDRIVPINTKDNTAARKAFRMKVLGMSGPEEADYWEDQKIKAGVTEPASFSNSVKAVFKVKGGISYCYRKDFKEGAAKILAVL